MTPEHLENPAELVMPITNFLLDLASLHFPFAILPRLLSNLTALRFFRSTQRSANRNTIPNESRTLFCVAPLPSARANRVIK